MQFLAPSLLLGLAAAILPWLIHRIGKRRANPVRFAAMELLLRAERKVSARRRLREILLLLLRTAIAASLPLVFAKPFAEIRSDLPAATTRPQSAVIVLDDSASLRRTAGETGGDPLFEQARAQARTLIEHLSPESDAALVLASEGTPTPIAEPSSDRNRLLAAVDATSLLGAAGRFLVGDPQGGADPGHVDAAGADHLPHHGSTGGGLGERDRAARDQLGAAAVRGGDPRRQRRRGLDQPRRRRSRGRAGARGRARSASRWWPRSRTSPTSRRRTSASR